MRGSTKKAGEPVEGDTPRIDVRAVQLSDALALHDIDYSFETDRIYTFRTQNHLLHNDDMPDAGPASVALTFELVETPIDPPYYKNFRKDANSLADVEQRLQGSEGGYVALANDEIAGGILLTIDEERSVSRISDLIVGNQYRRYGVGSLLLKCAVDWARKRGCWAIVLETQSVNYPAIQLYLRNGLEVWGINQHYYPPGPIEHEISVLMGMRVTA
ncbi:MAG TPA: hypothetical protein DHW02_07730 [Ktedonobacter sp.]|nr:hypothetical protein [Ktedonobacter sp.]